VNVEYCILKNFPLYFVHRDFGNKIVQIKPMVKFLPKLLEDRDKNVREEAKQLVIEMYRWVGPAIRPKLVDFKPLQVSAALFSALLCGDKLLLYL